MHELARRGSCASKCAAALGFWAMLTAACELAPPVSDAGSAPYPPDASMDERVGDAGVLPRDLDVLRARLRALEERTTMLEQRTASVSVRTAMFEDLGSGLVHTQDVKCAQSEVAIAGGARLVGGVGAEELQQSFPIGESSAIEEGNSPIGWRTVIKNGGASPVSLILYVICARL